MGSSALAADERVLGVEFSNGALSVSLRDGRTITVPLAWYPRLLNATVAQRKNWKIAGGGYGIHWPEVDEDLSTEGLLRGAPAPSAGGVSGLRLGPVDMAHLPSDQSWLFVGPARPVQPSALDAASVDAVQQTA